MGNILTRELLLKSVDEWNEVRRANPDLKPDLSGADLRNADISASFLSNADLRNANLSFTNLSDASLTDANLNGAHLIGAHFIRTFCYGANLCGADLSAAYFMWANLSLVNFSDSDLFGAHFSGVDLSEAYFRGAKVGNTTFSAVDLSKANGLESIWHQEPSTIGIDTIYKSNGNIPDAFLQGCGAPAVVIKLIRELNPKASDYYSCFISHSSLDKDFVERLYDELKAKGVPCYYAPHDLPIGAKTRLTIHEKIRNYDKLLLVLSEHSVKSGWVEDEVEHAFDLEKERGMPVLFPIRLDTVVMASKTGWASSVKNQRNIGDFTEWNEDVAYKAAFNRLLRDLKK